MLTAAVALASPACGWRSELVELRLCDWTVALEGGGEEAGPAAVSA